MTEAITIGAVTMDARDYASQGSALLGIRDSGKSYSATWLAERLLDAGIPFIAFDPIGLWRWLKVGVGEHPGYPVIVAGGEHGDLPLTVASAPEIVRAAMREGVSLVIDLYSMDLSKADWKRIVQSCVRVLLYENKRYGLRHVFIEEAAEFCPQRVAPDQGVVFAEIEKLARMGGNALLGYTLINQRAEEVNKAVLELCDNLFLHRQKGKNSLNSLTKWLDVADAKGAGGIIKSLPTLPQGDCWAWASGSDEPVRVHVPAKNTFHPDRRAMREHGEPTHARAIDVSAFVAQMTAALAEAEKPVLISSTTKEGAKINTAAISAAREEGYQAGLADGRRAAEADAAERLRTMQAAIDAALGYLVPFVKREGGDVPVIDVRRPAAPPVIDVRRPAAPPVIDVRRPAAPPMIEHAPPAISHTTRATAAPPAQSDDRRGSGAELRILKVLAQRHPARLSDAQWATLAGMKRTGGTWSTYKSRLRTAGHIEQGGDKLFAVTRAGLRAADHVPAAPASAADVIAMWKRALGDGPSRMLDALIASHPQPMDRANLADRVRMTATGGTFSTYLSRLKTNGLVDVIGRRVKVSPTLMDGGP
jgi:hypothetical protein